MHVHSDTDVYAQIAHTHFAACTFLDGCFRTALYIARSRYNYSATVKFAWRKFFGQEQSPYIHSVKPHFFVHLLNEDSSLKQTVCFVPGERKSLPLYNYIISFNLLNMNTLLINTLSMAPSVSVLTDLTVPASREGV